MIMKYSFLIIILFAIYACENPSINKKNINSSEIDLEKNNGKD